MQDSCTDMDAKKKVRVHIDVKNSNLEKRKKLDKYMKLTTKEQRGAQALQVHLPQIGKYKSENIYLTLP